MDYPISRLHWGLLMIMKCVDRMLKCVDNK